MPSHHYLLVSHHLALAQVVGDAFGRQHRFSIAETPERAFYLMDQETWEAVLLDARDLDFCPSIRTHWKGPLVLLVSNESKQSVLPGYEYGADLHVMLPCDSRELVARVSSVVRRSVPYDSKKGGTNP